ncbi:DUF4017 family protein [Rossellomorea marisflavi]|uniref:DUF4017 family protein n=1 Tax=Rossellomorea marisflavi TaxID=189381 RepID=UPI00404442E2
MFLFIWGGLLVLLVILISLLPKSRYLWVIPPAAYLTVVTIALLGKSSDPGYDVWGFKFAIAQFIAIPLFVITAGVIFFRFHWRKPNV